MQHDSTRSCVIMSKVQFPKALTVAQLEAEGPLRRNAIYREIKQGRLVARKVGKSTVVLVEDWETYLRALPRLGVDVAITEPPALIAGKAAKRQAVIA
jgi:hypothetical protein